LTDNKVTSKIVSDILCYWALTAVHINKKRIS